MSVAISEIPTELRDLAQWVPWRPEQRDGKTTKVPCRPSEPNRRASTTDPGTWGTVEAAVGAAPTNGGPGFVFAESDPFAGIDFDDCVTEDGVLHPAVAEIVAGLDSYTEFSPSRTGVHVIVRAELNGGRNRTKNTPWGGEFENYNRGRFFCMTGAHVPGTPRTVNERQAELDAIRARLLPDEAKQAPRWNTDTRPPSLDDRELLDKAFSAKNGQDLERLWRGDTSAYDGDDSRADLALCGALAFWTGPDPERLDGLMRQSGLMRPKWNERRGEATYGRQTIDKALNGRTEFYGDGQTMRRRTSSAGGLAVTFDEKGKLVLPELPAHDDAPGLCAWLTAAFNLNPAHPVTGCEWQGHAGPDGQIAVRRASARDLRFEPARAINTPMRLIEAFTGRRHPGDGMLHPYKGEHCRQISYAIQCLCDTSAAQTEHQEAEGILGTYLQAAAPVEGLTTYGTTAQRYEAARGLRRDVDDLTGRPIGPPRYLVDDNTGEYVIAVSELADAARRHVGSSLPRGWLDGRMANLGWQRVLLDGHETAGRDGRTGAHATVNAYRGHLPTHSEQVTK